MIRFLTNALEHAADIAVIGALVIVLLILGGCATVDRPIEGPAMSPPSGFVGYCMRYPDREECK